MEPSRFISGRVLRDKPVASRAYAATVVHVAVPFIDAVWAVFAFATVDVSTSGGVDMTLVTKAVVVAQAFFAYAAWVVKL